MPPLDVALMNGLVASALTAATTTERGRALEDLVTHAFSQIPGITITRRNTLNVFSTEEIDVALWNEGDPHGLASFPQLILVECKNWSQRVSSNEVSWFDTKLRKRGVDFGVLVTPKGITGNPHDITAAHSIVAGALAERRRMIVISTDEIIQAADTTALVVLIKEKVCDLVVSGTIV